MARSMTAAAVARYLALPRAEFEARDAAGEFSGFADNGEWTVLAAERAYQRLHGMRVVCRPADAARLITEVRQVGEVVRAYGDMPELDDESGRAGRGGIASQVSFDLHMIAAKLETMLRGTVFLDEVSGSTLGASTAVFAGEDASEFMSERRIEFEFGAVDSIRPPVDVDDARRIAELRAACEQLDAIRAGLDAAMVMSAGRGGVYLLGVQRDVIAAHIEELEARTLAAAERGEQ